MNSTVPPPPDTGASGGAGIRTVWELFYSCAATIIACIWVSIHPNVPGRRDSRFDKLKRRIGLMFIALIGPEIIVLFALRQRNTASLLCKGVCTYPSPALCYQNTPRSHRVCVVAYEKHASEQITSKRHGLLQRAWRSISGYFGEYYPHIRDFTRL
jgi:hypothetical protein